MSTRGYSASPSPLGQNSPNPFSTAISSLRSTYQTEAASEDALQYIDSVLRSRSTSPTNMPHGNHEMYNTQVTNIVTVPKPRSHSVTPKASLIMSPLVPHRPLSTGINDNDNGTISCMRSAAFDKSQNIAQPIPSHPPLAFISSGFVNSEINITGTLISLPALMDKPQAYNFPSSTDPTFVLQNIYATNANNLLQTKGYVEKVTGGSGQEMRDHTQSTHTHTQSQ
ncbi:hypothetical protein AMATHDRAFT_11415 [Amanita thiersii Skay4041]|uniref:Uncharacterized protein n=1 Tax=Amanita thiersii Skay4041 TaxID=703135 RepID=A0A2A9NAF0_9AGAR|nr:hypothetical protein AMATHDRAFT_11415 [Amanita thiersii Skay4041]